MVEVAVKHLESVASGKAVDDLREQEKKEEKTYSTTANKNVKYDN
jgi:hypothetical protein